jgi:hypothetical protein
MLMLQNFCDCLLCLETSNVHLGGDKLIIISIKNCRVVWLCSKNDIEVTGYTTSVYI